MKSSKSDALGIEAVASSNLFVLSKDSPSLGWMTYRHGLLGYLEEGLLELRTVDEGRIFSAGSIIYVPPGRTHLKRTASANIGGCFFSIPEPICVGLSNEITLFGATDLLVPMLRRLASYSEGADQNRDRLLMALGDELKLLKPISQLNLPFPRHPSLAGVATQIMETPSDMKSIDYWAKQAGMSRRSFTKYFKDQTGLTFAIWRQRVKLIAAIKLFESGKNSTDLALSVGYKNASTFTTVFSRQFGMPPGKYIQTKRGKDGSSSEEDC